MKFYRMKFGLFEVFFSALFFLIVAILYTMFFVPIVRHEMRIIDVYTTIVLYIFPFLFSLSIASMYRKEELHSLWMKVHVNEAGICCCYKNVVTWRCFWEEIDHFQWCRYRYHVCRKVIMKDNAGHEFYFELSRSAKRAISYYCPLNDLLSQL